jgi:hypothetical protein
MSRRPRVRGAGAPAIAGRRWCWHARAARVLRAGGKGFAAGLVLDGATTPCTLARACYLVSVLPVGRPVPGTPGFVLKKPSTRREGPRSSWRRTPRAVALLVVPLPRRATPRADWLCSAATSAPCCQWIGLTTADATRILSCTTPVPSAVVRAVTSPLSSGPAPAGPAPRGWCLDGILSRAYPRRGSRLGRPRATPVPTARSCRTA